MDLEPEGIVPPDTDHVFGGDPVVREIEELIGKGELEAALDAIDDAIDSGAGNRTDLAFLRGDTLLGLGMASAAEDEFRLVLERDPDCPSSRCWLAQCLFLQWRFDEAERAVAAARELPDALPDADILLGCLLERRGQLAEADSLFARAAAVDPSRYLVPVRMTRDEFDQEVRKAARKLPRQFRNAFDRVPCIVQDLPEDAFAEFGEDEITPDILGLFDGVPLPDTAELAGQLRPNRIYLFQRNLERMSLDRQDLIEQIRITLWHELGHYLGFEEEDMDDLGLA